MPICLSPLLADALAWGEPSALWALLSLPLLALLFAWAQRRSARALAQIVAPRLRAQLAAGVSHGKRRLRFALQLVALAGFILALAQPQLGFDMREVKRRGLDLIIAIDTSKSMLATDVEPNRLARAKLAAYDLIALSKGDRLGVIAFAGRAFLMAPLTIDYGAVLNAVNELNTDSIPRGGTNLAESIQLALEAFGKGEGADRAIIFMTDGEDLEADAVAAAKKAAEAGVKIFCLGIGSPEGSLLPLPGGGFVRDRSGQLVRSKLDESRLREIAQLTSGRYVRLTAGSDPVNELHHEGIAKLKAAELDVKASMRPIERFQWPLGSGLLALAGAMLIQERKAAKPVVRAPRKAAALAALALAVVGLPLQAATSAREGLRLYGEQKFSEAETAFENAARSNPDSPRAQFNVGAAAYQQKAYPKAGEAFGRVLAAPDESLHAMAHYNLGNTLFRQGEGQKDGATRVRDWEDALKHYESTLKLEPENADAKNNAEIVRRALEEEKKKQPPPQKDDKKDKKDKSDKDKKDKKDGDKQAKNDPQKQKDQKKDPKKEGDKSADEKQQEKGDEPDKKDSPGEGKDGQEQPPQNSQGDEEGKSGDEQKPPQNEPGKGKQGNEPKPAPEQENKPQGDVQAREPQNAPQPQENGTEQKEGQPMQEGKLTPGQARQLLDALKGEDDRVILSDRFKRQEPVYKDW